MSVYFAHPMSDYGTAWERRVIEHLLRGFQMPIVNPGERYYQSLWEGMGMQCFDTVFLPYTSILAFSPFPNGQIGSGVGYEIDASIKAGKAIYEIDRSLAGPFRYVYSRSEFDKLRERYVTREETRVLIRRYAA